ncbi:zgc:103586 isoform X1 [Brienomyrus brachyistius]|uniref:zgc:103586 isoform X1 n=1 Tax=Brienomyrus brachyistius TaxID=42636 RepID=UPI0020B20CC3|nr:zgc:103586 isoform X1 [Brienomyrus brachyistius]
MEESGNLLRGVENRSQVSVPVQVVFKVLMAAFPVTQIAVGAVHLNDCPQQHYIPIFLLVSGICGLVMGTLCCLPCAHRSEDHGWRSVSSLCGTCSSLLTTFYFCWFITGVTVLSGVWCEPTQAVKGNVWIYSIYPANYNQTVPGLPYCNKTVYQFAFWTSTLLYISLGAMLLGCIFILIYLWLYGRRQTIGRFNWTI